MHLNSACYRYSLCEIVLCKNAIVLEIDCNSPVKFLLKENFIQAIYDGEKQSHRLVIAQFNLLFKLIQIFFYC